MFKAIFFDLSGVLYDGKKVIPGAVEAVLKAQQSELEVRFVTNTSRMSRTQILSGLQNMGFELSPEQLFTAPAAAKALVQKNNWRPYCLVHANIHEEFSNIDQSAPNAVIIGDAADDFCYKNLNHAFQLVHAGAPLIGIGDNRYFKLDGTLNLDAGPFIHAIEYAASTKAIIMGKPSVDFFNLAADSVGAIKNEILMVGDDILGDIGGAINAGLQACLVKTGKYQAGDESLIDKDFLRVDSICQAVDFALN